jgi:crotonobetainyl-CoA:carnitine CoA-transferase CaiB-like acyl-CoA transferase
MAEELAAPLRGLRVVEVASGISRVGAGLAGSLPGALLRDLGAEVVRVQTTSRFSLDEGVEWGRVWDRGKQVVEVDQEYLAPTAAGLAKDADVIFLVGPEETLERRGLGYRKLSRSNPRLVVARIRPSVNATGGMPDLELLVAARTGLLTQVAGHRPGPVFCGLPVASAGAGLGATAGALACLYEREATGAGGWVETSLYDGILALLPMIAGRAEHPTAAITSLWGTLGPALALSFRCSDGEYIQLWFGAKGAYESFLEQIGDAPSEAGYRGDTMSGAIGERSKRWAETFATRERDWWVAHLAGHDFRCEPVLRPGEELRDPHLREIGLSVEHDDPDRGPITVPGPIGRVTPVPSPVPFVDNARGGAPARLLSGIRVLDLSAYLAGPVTPLILAELGADVVKVEPTTGDAHRNVEAMFAAGQRGKRAVALDLKASDATSVMHRLFAWADVVHHNARLGLAERLGYDEATVRSVNPNAIYSHASGFGSHGPRAPLPANDHLMQALSGVEADAGGEGQPPTWVNWGAIDVSSGWVSACAVLAGLWARRRTGRPQSVTTNLLAAALTLKSGSFLAGDAVVEGPIVNAGQTGYGAAYRIYQAADGTWLALAVPDTEVWQRLADVVGVDLPLLPPPLRTRPRLEAQGAEEAVLERAFATKDGEAWLTALRAAGVPAERVVEWDRSEFNARIVDDPVNRSLGRVASFPWGARGRVDQPAFPVRLGPAPRPAAPQHIPDLGEQTDEMLGAIGFDADQRAALAAGGVIGTADDR